MSTHNIIMFLWRNKKNNYMDADLVWSCGYRLSARQMLTWKLMMRSSR